MPNEQANRTAFAAVDDLTNAQVCANSRANKQLLSLVGNERALVQRLKTQRRQIQANKAAAWMVLLLVRLAVIDAAAALALVPRPDRRWKPVAPIERAFGSYVEPEIAVLEALVASGKLQAEPLLRCVKDQARALRTACCAEQGVRNRGKDRTAKATAWLEEHRRIHDISGMAELRRRSDDLSDVLTATVAKGDAERLIRVNRHLGHQLWVLERVELREALQTAVGQALESRRVMATYPIDALDAAIQGRGLAGALKALVSGENYNYVLENPELIDVQASTWRRQLAEIKPQGLGETDRRYRAETEAAISRYEALGCAKTAPQRAVKLFRRACDTAMKAGNQSLGLTALRELAWTLRSQGNLDAAREVLVEALQVSYRQGNQRRTIQMHIELAELYASRNDGRHAKMHIMIAQSMFDLVQGPSGVLWYQPSWLRIIEDTRTAIAALPADPSVPGGTVRTAARFS